MQAAKQKAWRTTAFCLYLRYHRAMRNLTNFLLASLLMLLIPLQGFAAISRLACGAAHSTPAAHTQTSHQHHATSAQAVDQHQHHLAAQASSDHHQHEHSKSCDKCSATCCASGILANNQIKPSAAARIVPPLFIAQTFVNFSSDQQDPPPRLAFM